MEERTESTTAWAVAFLFIAVVLTLIGGGAIWFGLALG